MIETFQDRINYIDPESGLFVEVVYYPGIGFSDPQPFYLSNEDMFETSLYDRPDDPRVVNGLSTYELITIQVQHKNETELRVF